MEIIQEIHEVKTGDRYYSKAGFEVVTSEQRIKLLIDNDGQCCERWGYFWCNDDTQDFIGATVLDVRITDTALAEAKLKEHDVYPNDTYFEGCILFVNIETDRGVLQFTAYNEHNGYYGHEASVECSQLSHSTYL